MAMVIASYGDVADERRIEPEDLGGGRHEVAPAIVLPRDWHRSRASTVLRVPGDVAAPPARAIGARELC